jgi:amino acid adenylation domain-containing protein
VILNGIIANPDQHLSQLPILTEAEREQLLVAWNDTRTDYPRESSVHRLFEEQVERTPDAVAVVYSEEQLTYSELNRKANRLASYLIRLGVKPEDLIGICMERSPMMIVGLLAILKAGGAYVPLDPTYPSERLGFMIEDTQMPVLLTEQHLVGKLPENSVHIVCLDVDWQTIATESDRNPVSGITGENLAYVMYTSGSTGKPKGASIPHRAVNRLVINTDYVHFGPDERIGQVSNSSFDALTFEVWGSLLHGGTLVGISKEVILSPREFAAVIREQKVSTMFLTAALFNQLAAEIPGIFSSMRNLLFGGEAADPRWVREVLSNAPPDRLLNGYGPTESTTFTCCCLVKNIPDEAASVPIGRPISNTQVYILDRHFQPVPVGVPGELYIGGEGLARDYLNRPELTAQKFIPDPFSNIPDARLYKTGDLARYLPDGNLDFLGRMDHQVKIRGFRIELGEIESVLGQHRSVREAIVVLREEAPGEKRLVAYVVPRQLHNAVDSIGSGLRTFLSEKLPDFMIPSAFVMLEALPITPNGKVDREALPVPDQIRFDPENLVSGPRDTLELQLTVAFEKVLGIQPMSVTDDFFDLGGHSLLAVRLFTEIEKVISRNLPIATLFQASTVERLAEVLRQEGWSPPWSSLVAIQRDGSKPPFFIVHRNGGSILIFRDLALHMESDQPLYGLQARGLDGRQPPRDSIEDMATHYVQEIRKIQPNGPYYVGGASFGGLVAFEMAQQLVEKREQVALLALLDTVPYPHKPTSRNAYVRTTLDLGKRALRPIKQLLTLPQHERLPYIRSKLSALKGKTQKGDLVMGGENAGPIRSGPNSLLPRAIQEVIVAADRAAQLYTLRPYPDRITLFRAGANRVQEQLGPDLGWGKWAGGGLDIYDVPGTHLTMLEEPNARVLAEKLTICLAKTHLARSVERELLLGV